MDRIAEQIALIRKDLPAHVTLVCVSKFQPAEAIQAAYAAGERDFGESIAAQRLMFPWWYCQGLWKWAGREREMPFDQHMLLACVAPRALLLECYDKKWFDPQGEWLAAQAAAPVWELLVPAAG